MSIIQTCKWTLSVINNRGCLRISVEEEIHPALQHDGGNGYYKQQTNGMHLFHFILVFIYHCHIMLQVD